MNRRRAAATLAGGLLAGCSKKPRPVAVGSKSSTEQTLLAFIAAQHLQRRLGPSVNRKPGALNTLNAHEAIIAGEFDLYPEYAGTAYHVILRAPLSQDAGVVRERVKDEYRNRFQLDWLPPLGFDNPFVMVVRSQDPAAGRISTLSEAAAFREGWKLGVSAEFQTRLDGLAAVVTAYRLRLEATPRTMQPAALYQALLEGEVNMISGSATDGMLASRDFKVLRDDKNATPPLEAAFVLRAESQNAFPGLRKGVEELSGKFTAESMRSMNRQVEVERRPESEVAAEFLRQVGLG